MPSRLATLPPVLSSMPRDEKDRDKKRAEFHPWRAWYKTRRWYRLRWLTLVRDLFTCQMCGTLQSDTSLLVADHRRPHRGDEALFFDETNLWTLCGSPCHSKHKQKLELAEMRGA